MTHEEAWRHWAALLKEHGVFLNELTWVSKVKFQDAPATFNELLMVLPGAYPQWWHRHGARVEELVELQSIVLPIRQNVQVEVSEAQEVTKPAPNLTKVAGLASVSRILVELLHEAAEGFGVGGEFSAAELCGHALIHPRTCSRAIAAGIAAGVVERAGGARYRILCDGEQLDDLVPSKPFTAPALVRFLQRMGTREGARASDVLAMLDEEGLVASRRTVLAALSVSRQASSRGKPC